MFVVMLSIYVSNAVQFFSAVCDEIQTLYVIGRKVTSINGPEALFRVYGFVKNDEK
jgi:hypothetical protein